MSISGGRTSITLRWGRPSAHESGGIAGMLRVLVVDEPRDFLRVPELLFRRGAGTSSLSGTEATSSMDNSSSYGALWLKGPSITSILQSLTELTREHEPFVAILS